MLRLYLIRHGETEWNKQARFQGQQEIPLNETGRAQAHLISKNLSDEGITAIYTSDLGRAQETARIIAGHLGIPGLHLDPHFREMNFGGWEGMTFQERMASDHELVKTWLADPVNTPCPQGESYALLFGRINEGLSEIKEKEKDKRVIVVTHGGPIRAAVQLSLGAPPSSFWNLRVDNASLSIIEFYEEKTILCLYNDICYLKR